MGQRGWRIEGLRRGAGGFRNRTELGETGHAGPTLGSGGNLGRATSLLRVDHGGHLHDLH